MLARSRAAPEPRCAPRTRSERSSTQLHALQQQKRVCHGCKSSVCRLLRRHTRSTRRRRRSSIPPPRSTRCPPPPAHGPADGGRGGWCRWSGPRGAGGNANAIRRARAELSLPDGRLAQASARSRPSALGLELTACGCAASLGMLAGQLRPAARRKTRTGRAWRAARTSSRAPLQTVTLPARAGKVGSAVRGVAFHDAHSAALDTGVIHFYSHWAGQ